MTKPKLLPPGRSLGYQVRRCHRMFDRMLTARLAPHALNSGFWYYLRALWIQDGITQKELSDITHVAENTTVAMINQMISSGLVERSRDAEDRRKQRISLTARGRSLHSALMHHAFDINAVAAAGIPKQDVETCLAVLARMGENLQQALAAPAATSTEVPRPAARRKPRARGIA